MTQKMERRFFRLQRLKVEARQHDDESTTRMITGHAAVFNSLSEDLGGFQERIAPGAFSSSIESDDIRALFNHNADIVLGRNRAGTLKLAEDETGLHVEINPPDTQAARDLAVSIDRGDIDQMSFGFMTLEDSWQVVEEKNVRTLIRAQLFDVSPVTFPAYPDTDVAVRSLNAAREHCASAIFAHQARTRVARARMFASQEPGGA